MDEKLLIVSIIFNLVICFGVPIAWIIFMSFKKKSIKPMLLGALIFIISQVFLRLPIIQVVLPKYDWYLTITLFYPVIYALFLGVSAGIFEEVFRFLGFKLLMKNIRGFLDGISFGVGHGSIEAILLVGIPNLELLLTGKYLSLIGVNFSDVILAGVERGFTIVIHIALTLVILYGLNKRKNIYLILAIILHSLLDFIVGLMGIYGVSVYLIEGVITLGAIISMIYILKLRVVFKDI